MVYNQRFNLTTKGGSNRDFAITLQTIIKTAPVVLRVNLRKHSMDRLQFDICKINSSTSRQLIIRIRFYSLLN